ncbi:hypothetical protein [Paenibacillus monticola]|uniref:Uncharacterized protein n=1 Tax=Paenibacillus monticola TaxID=2666075 RepID=A0A7X2H354_9BACL|nr:hypothetical protein [Paenibacillus monticola]MRN52515.1 hypothetical protein [Paenibacillus monticola]
MIMINGVVCSSCSVIKDKPAKEDLALALSGVTGSDALSFEGAATLLREGKAVPETTLYYGGKVENHNKVSLYTLLPDKSPSLPAATSDIKELVKRPTVALSYYSKLEKKEGKWKLLSAAPSSGEDNPLPALNPLHQLEELEVMDKVVTEEMGAARGTRVLRIELTSAQARDQLSTDLEREMMDLRPVLKDQNPKTNEKDLKVNEALLTLWEKKNSELQKKLEQAEISAVYHVTVDTKRNLPKRLTWKRTVNYSGEKTDTETYVMEVDFYGYR